MSKAPFYKAVPAPDYDGKPAWNGWYQNRYGQWAVVRNADRNAICYASAQAAIDRSREIWEAQHP